MSTIMKDDNMIMTTVPIPITITVHLMVDGMMCQRNCGTTVENALRAMNVSSIRNSDTTTSTTTTINIIDVKAIFVESRAYITFQIIQNQLEQVEATIVQDMNDIYYQQLVDEAIDTIDCIGFDATVINNIDTYMNELSLVQKQVTATPSPPPPPVPPLSLSTKSSKPTIILSIQGMSCAVCTGRVEKVLKQIPIVSDAIVVLATNQAIVELVSKSNSIVDNDNDNDDDDDDIDNNNSVQDCINAIIQAGYECELVSDSRCTSNKSSSTTGNKTTTTTDSLRRSAEQMDKARINELQSWKMLCITSVLLTIPLIYICNIHSKVTTACMNNTSTSSMNNSTTIHEFSTVPCSENDMKNNMMMDSNMLVRMWIACIIATIVQIIIGKRFYIAAYKGIRYGFVIGMDFLIVLGTTCSYIYSVIVLLLLQYYYIKANSTSSTIKLEPTFMTGPMLLSFVTFGKFLESYAKGKTASALKRLMELQPLSANKVIVHDDNNNKELNSTTDIASLTTIEVTVSELQIGDYVRVLPGGRIPTDSRLIAISSSSVSVSSSSNTTLQSEKQEQQYAYIDESALTGEPFPVPKCVNDIVIGSTINQLSVLVVQVTAIGEGTTLSKIVRLMEHAQRNKAPIQAYADYVASIFAPIIISLSCITFILWITLYQPTTTITTTTTGMINTVSVSMQERFFWALTSAISVIVVACPCALGLATPTAVMVGTGVGASLGLLIKGGSVLEHMHKTDTIIFDKTGTLTTGKAIVSDYINEQQLLLSSSSNDFDTTTNNNNIKSLYETDSLYTQIPTQTTIDLDNIALLVASCAEIQSEHPLAKAIVNYARSKLGVNSAAAGIRTTDFFIVPGSGVQCTISAATEATTAYDVNTTNNQSSSSSSSLSWGPWQVRVGTRSWTKSLHHQYTDNKKIKYNIDDEHLIDTDPIGDVHATKLRSDGKIVIYISVLDVSNINNKNGDSSSTDDDRTIVQTRRRRVIGVMGIVDPIHQEAKTTVLALQKMGIDVWMCTGDHILTASAVAKQVGVHPDNIRASATPESKADLVTQLQSQRVQIRKSSTIGIKISDDDQLSFTSSTDRPTSIDVEDQKYTVQKESIFFSKNNTQKRNRGGRVAVVGDGINDAIALARADVGIAIGAGTEVAVEAADVVLVKSSLHDVVVAIHLSNVVFQRIMINFVWAMGYNLLAVPFAAGLFYPITSYRLPPEMAGLMMAFSSVSVVTSSLLLRTYQRPIINNDGTLGRQRKQQQQQQQHLEKTTTSTTFTDDSDGIFINDDNMTDQRRTRRRRGGYENVSTTADSSTSHFVIDDEEEDDDDGEDEKQFDKMNVELV